MTTGAGCSRRLCAEVHDLRNVDRLFALGNEDADDLTVANAGTRWRVCADDLADRSIRVWLVDSGGHQALVGKTVELIEALQACTCDVGDPCEADCGTNACVGDDAVLATAGNRDGRESEVDVVGGEGFLDQFGVALPQYGFCFP